MKSSKISAAQRIYFLTTKLLRNNYLFFKTAIQKFGAKSLSRGGAAAATLAAKELIYFIHEGYFLFNTAILKFVEKV